MTTIDKKPPHQVAEEIFYLVERQGSAIAALGELVLIANTQKMSDSTIEGIGRMLEMFADNLIETAMAGVNVCQPPPTA